MPNKEVIAMDFKTFLKQKRVERKIPVRKFAKLINISPSFLCDLEGGLRNFPLNSKKNPNLFNDIVVALDLDSNEREMMKKLIEESLISNQTITPTLSDYLLKTPSAQQALRRATEANLSNEDWDKIIEAIDKGR